MPERSKLRQRDTAQRARRRLRAMAPSPSKSRIHRLGSKPVTAQPLAAAVEVLEQSTTAAGADKASPVNSIPNTPFIFALLIVLDLRSRRHVAVGWLMAHASLMSGKEISRSLS